MSVEREWGLVGEKGAVVGNWTSGEKGDMGHRGQLSPCQMPICLRPCVHSPLLSRPQRDTGLGAPGQGRNIPVSRVDFVPVPPPNLDVWPLSQRLTSLQSAGGREHPSPAQAKGAWASLLRPSPLGGHPSLKGHIRGTSQSTPQAPP